MIIKKNITYKKKLVLLVLAILAVFILSYNLAIKETIELYTICDSLETESEKLKNAPEIISELKKKINAVELNASVISDSGFSFQKHIFGIMERFNSTNPVVLVEVSEVSGYQNSDYCIETHNLKVSGSFIPILKLIYEFEKKSKPGKLVSVHFERVKDNKTGQNQLFCSLFLQKINKGKYEEDL